MTEKAVEATNYIRRNGYLVLRSALPLNDLESWVSLWRNTYGGLDGFPWEEIYGEYPSREVLAREGITTCPICDKSIVSKG